MTPQARPELLPMELLRHVNHSLSELLGCLLPEDRMAQLSRALGRAASRMGMNDAAVLCRLVIERRADEAAIEELAAELLPGETYFYRDPHGMNALRQELLPRLLHERHTEKSLGIWSAACSTGEEPLTLAMLLRACLADPSGWTIRILATDLRARALAAARLGSYRDWSFRDCPEWIKKRHFVRNGSGAWNVSPEILALVDYRPFNLVRDPFPPPNPPPGGFDLIVCRNVLIYLDPSRIPPLLEKLWDCLAEGGWLWVAAVEAPAVSLERYECVRLGEALFFRKRNAAAASPGADAAVPGAPQAKTPSPSAAMAREMPGRLDKP